MQCQSAIDLYERMILDDVCPEQARFVLPQGVETQWIWTGNLYSYANFVRKRMSEDSQKEIRHLAWLVSREIYPLFPVSWKALVEE
jgi:thymidylate synthase (FAD)